MLERAMMLKELDGETAAEPGDQFSEQNHPHLDLF